VLKHQILLFFLSTSLSSILPAETEGKFIEECQTCGLLEYEETKSEVLDQIKKDFIYLDSKLLRNHINPNTNKDFCRMEPEKSTELCKAFIGSDKCNQPPYLSEFTKGDRKLSFLASAHKTAISDNLSTRNAIDELVSKKNTDVVAVLEGFPVDFKVTKQVLGQIKDCKRKNWKERECYEGLYALSITLDEGIPFRGGEPKAETISNHLESKKYSKWDVHSFFCLRNLLEKKFVDIKSYEIELKSKCGFTSQKDLDQFNNWVSLKTDGKFNHKHVRSSLIEPKENSGTEINKMAFETDVVRELSYIDTLQDLLNENKDVTLVLGEGHMIKHRKVLESAFTKRLDTCF
tara:strand:- start:9235 stop:10275 length:1041 start_codon:yes stop_codon:yes gene_type:complete